MSLLLLGLLVAFFLVVWVTYLNKVSPDDWESMYPRAIPLATFFIVSGTVLMTTVMWSVWGILSPIFTFIYLRGIVAVVALIPDDGQGNLKSIHSKDRR